MKHIYTDEPPMVAGLLILPPRVCNIIFMFSSNNNDPRELLYPYPSLVREPSA